MSGTYLQCSQCGKRALSVATRCPQCGAEFPPRPLPQMRRPVDLRRYLAVLAIAGVAAGLIVLAMAALERIRKTPAEHAASVTEVGRDTAVAAASLPASAGVRRFARTWTKVRTQRSSAGDVAGILLPGDTVLVDSLRGGWWRVTFEGKVLGYLHQSTLEMEPAAPGP
jgi:hypothetical protein